MFVGLWGNTFAYEIDEALILEEKSVYLFSMWNFKLDANGNNKTGTDENYQRFNTDVGVNRIVENKKIGYWFNSDVEFTFEKDVNGTSETEKTTTLNIRNFETSSVQGLSNNEMADAGLKFYLSEQSPFYFYMQALADWLDTKTETTSPTGTVSTQDNGIEYLLGGGLGYGKIVDLGSYDRVLIVQDQLLNNNMIKSEFSRDIIRELLPLFRINMDHTVRLIKIQEILIRQGLIDSQGFSLNRTKEILNALDKSFDKRLYGLEFRIGYLKEQDHRDSNPDQEKIGYLYTYIKYEKPLSEKHQYICQINGLYQKAKEQNDEKISGYWSNVIDSILSANLNTKIGLEINFSKELEIDSHERVFGQLRYEVTDRLMWTNEIEYYQYQYGDPNAEDSFEYTLSSKLEYTIW